MSEIQETLQIMAMSGRGAIMLGKASVAAIQFFMQLKYSKDQKALRLEYGEMSFEKLQEKEASTGDQTTLFQVATQDPEELSVIKKELTDRGISFSQLQDFNIEDGLTQFYSLASDAAKLNGFYSRHSELQAKEISLDDYENTAPPEAKEKLRNEAIEASANEIKKEELIKKKELKELVENKPIELLKEDKLHHQGLEDKYSMYLFKHPNNENQFLLLPTEEVVESEKNFLLMPDIEKEYSVADESGAYVDTLTGTNLIELYKPDEFNAIELNSEKRLKEVKLLSPQFQEAAKKLKDDSTYLSLVSKENTREITLNESLKIKENERSIMFRVPNSAGKKSVEFDKAALRKIDGGKTYAAVLDLGADMNVRHGETPVKMKGDELYNFFDRARSNLHNAKVKSVVKDSVKKVTDKVL